MRKGVAIARTISRPSRPRVASWLFLALLLALMSLFQLAHPVKAGASVLPEQTLMSGDQRLDQDCPALEGAVPGSHCGSMAGCSAAVADVPAVASPLDTGTAPMIAGDAAAAGRASSPLFHPPKAAAQA